MSIIFLNSINKTPLLSYTLYVFIFPHLTTLSSAMIMALASSIFSIDFSLSPLMFSPRFVLIKILSIIHLRTLFPPCASFCSMVNPKYHPVAISIEVSQTYLHNLLNEIATHRLLLQDFYHRYLTDF